MTAVEWFFKALIENQDKTYEQIELILEQAKEMEKEQIMTAHYATKYGCFSKDYYNETYESKTNL